MAILTPLFDDFTGRLYSIIASLYGTETLTGSLPPPNDLGYAYSKIKELDKLFPQEDCISDALKANMKILKITVKEFQSYLEAETTGQPFEYNQNVLPRGPDHDWLKEMINILDAMVEENISSTRTTTAKRHQARLLAESRYESTGLFNLGHDEIVHRVRTREGKQIKIRRLETGMFCEGAWSIVHKCEVIAVDDGVDIPVGTIVALKELSPRRLETLPQGNQMMVVRWRMQREQSFWRKLSHENIARFIGCIENPRPGLVSIWYDNGTLERHIMESTSPNRLDLLSGCANGLSYLHKEGLIHGDIRPVNVLIDDKGNPVLIDFGGTFDEEELRVPATITTSRLPTEPRYMATERTRYQNKPSYKSDVYSYGCLALFIMTGLRPFRHISHEDDIIKLRVSPNEQDIPFPAPLKYYPKLPAIIWPLLTDCWDLTPTNRPDMATVLMRVNTLNRMLNNDVNDLTVLKLDRHIATAAGLLKSRNSLSILSQC
ncbi:hypothetical protein FRC02_010079 [Tulasnella sp. 418]|nr:hypothetical protein FRC02_010079 [Tulasnella sp. 418]